jgi:HEAT repeat protein
LRGKSLLISFIEQTDMNKELEQILDDLKSADPDVKENALDKIAQLKPDNALELIIPFLDDPEEEVRSGAAFSLGELNDSATVPYLISLIKRDNAKNVRQEVVCALENYSGSEIQECLVEQAFHPEQSNITKRSIAQQLEKYDEESSIDALIHLLDDWDATTRELAAKSLYQLNRPRLKPVWKDARHDRNGTVQKIARNALKELLNN